MRPGRSLTCVVVLLVIAATICLPVENGVSSENGVEDVPSFTFSIVGEEGLNTSKSELVPRYLVSKPFDGPLNNITLTFKYQLQDGAQEAPCEAAHVKLLALNGTSFQISRSGHTEVDGAIAFSGLPSGTYKARVEADDDRWVRVTDGWTPGSPNYFWSTHSFTVNSDTTLEYLISDDARGVWAVYSNLRDGAHWLHERTGWERSQVTVVWPEGDWPHSHGNEIHLPSDRSFLGCCWSRDVVLHEYAHCVHFELRGGSFPKGDGPDPHHIDSESSPGFAFTEGWAQFFERAVEGDPVRSDGESLESTVFADGPNGHGDSGDMDGVIVEGAVANVLWDLFDGVNEEDRPPGSEVGDLVDNGFSILWSIMYHRMPESLEDIKRAWPERSVNVTAVFHNSRVPMELDPPRNPSFFRASHELGEGSRDSTISVTWSGAWDGGSGVLGYSILLSSDPFAIPDKVLDRTGRSYTSHSLSPGTYYLHIRTVDRDGNWADDVYTIGPFVIEDGAVPVDDPSFLDGDLKQALLGTVVVLAIVGSMLLTLLGIDRRSAPKAGKRGTGSGHCPYCGRADHFTQFCPYCGGRLR